MKSVLAALISVACVTVLAWMVQAAIVDPEDVSNPTIKLSSTDPIEESLFLEISDTYESEFSSIVLEEPHPGGSAGSFFVIAVVGGPYAFASIALHSIALRLMRRKNAEPVAGGAR